MNENILMILTFPVKRKKTDHEQQRELHAAGLKGSAKWATRATNHVPSSELNPEEVSLIDSGACGAFVYGLEDELLEVSFSRMHSSALWMMVLRQITPLSMSMRN